MTPSFPMWTLLPFGVLVLGIASLPLLFPDSWGKHGFQAFVSLGCASPVVGFLLLEGHQDHLIGAGKSYVSFVATIGKGKSPRIAPKTDPEFWNGPCCS